MCPINALYARQSLDKKDSISIESQLEFCQYETHGEAFETYIDKGFSGKNTNRPAFTQLMEDIKAGKIKRVIVYKLDRISRSVLDFSYMMEVFQEHHVEFVSSTEKFDTSTPIGNAMLNIAIVFAQLERETIQKRVTDAYYSKSQKGYYMGGRVPFGFRLERTIINGIHTSVFVPDDAEIKVVKFIYQSYSDPDVTLGAVLRELMDREYVKIGTISWCTARVSQLLCNPIYVRADINVYRFFESQGAHIVNPAADFIGTNGIFLYKGYDGDKKKLKQYDLKNREVVLAPHEGVIDAKTWLKCRLKLMNNRKCARTSKGKRSWLTGKVKCKKCGYAYTVTKADTKAGRYFQCSGARYAIKCRGSGNTIYADIFEDYIFQEIRKELYKLQNISIELEQAESPTMNHNKVRIAEIDKEIESLLSKIISANQTVMNYINDRIDELDREKRTLQEKLVELTTNKAIEKLDKYINCIEKWSEMSLDDKQRIADILIKVIYIDEDVIEIEWNI